MSGKIKILLVVALLGGPVMAIVGWKEQQLLAHLAANGKEVQGRLESGEVKRGRRGSKTYKFDVAYTPEGAQEIVKTFTVTKDFVQRVVQADTIVDDTCSVRYDPTNPDDAIIVGGSNDNTAMLPIGLGIFAIGAVGCWLAFRKRANTPAMATA